MSAQRVAANYLRAVTAVAPEPDVSLASICESILRISRKFADADTAQIERLKSERWNGLSVLDISTTRSLVNDL